MSRKRHKNRPPDRRPPADRNPPARRHATSLAVCVLLLLAVLAVFGQTARHAFINLDDSAYAYDNPHITGGLTPQSVAWAFSHSHAGHWHPLTSLSHMLDCQMYGVEAGAHHFTAVLLHAASAIMLFLVLRQMTGSLWASAWVAALFAIHPLRAESVAWVSERKDVLSGLFFVLTLAAYVAYQRRPFSLGRYLVVVVLFALGLMAKSVLVTLPFVLLLLDYWPLGRMTSAMPRSAIWRLVLEKIPLLVLTIAICVVTPLAQGSAMVALDAIPFPWRIANALVSYVTYLGQFLFPVGLALSYPHPGNSLPLWQVAAAILVLLGITVAAVWWRRRYPYLLVGWLWYVGMLVPVIGLVQVGQNARADRYTYLAQIGLGVAVAWGIAQAVAARPRLRPACGAAAVLVLSVLAACGWQQTSYWRDSKTLWTRSLACTERNHLAHANLALVLLEEGHSDEGIAHLQEALQIRPDYAKGHGNLALALTRANRTDEATLHYQKALALRPNDAIAHNNFGALLLQCGRLDEAIAHYRQAMEIDPQYPSAHTNLGLALYQAGQMAEAATELREAVRLRPNHLLALNQLAWLLATCSHASLRNGREAVSLAERAARLCGNREPAILGTLAAAYAETGQSRKAVETASRAVDLATARGDTRLADACRARRELYRSGRAYHDPPGPPRP
jgi:protein O-mannosyl-transferase